MESDEDELTWIAVEDTICIQTDTNYLGPYARYFERHPRPPNSAKPCAGVADRSQTEINVTGAATQ